MRGRDPDRKSLKNGLIESRMIRKLLLDAGISSCSINRLLQDERDESSRNSRFQFKNGARGSFTMIGWRAGGEAVPAKLTERAAFPFRTINNIDNITTFCLSTRLIACCVLILEPVSTAAMSASRTSPSWLVTLFTVLTVLSAQVRALHVYMEGQQRKCFFEELPKDTLVVGKALQYSDGGSLQIY